MRLAFVPVMGVFFAATANAHHSVLHYDGKTEVRISGVISKARYGFPHSKYQIEVRNDDGSSISWTLTTEDPRDARRLGFAEAIKALRPGDEIAVIGWPHKFNNYELRGHQLHYPDGRVVMLRRGNYIWPKDILRLDKLYYSPSDIPASIRDSDTSRPFDEQLVEWIDEGDHVARAAWESAQQRPRLIGIRDQGEVTFSGIDELLSCHTERPDFRVVVDLADLDGAQREIIQPNSTYVSEYNRVLSRWWEQEHESCD
ncbi:MAG: hypothetical protein KJO31_13745 [Gammaproteobacteria bacterium]|nr:hypothetical protein [Gammaproteobacteria bacterium]